MRMRGLVRGAMVAGFVGIVVQAAAANQCPASALGACARLHLEFMRSRRPASPVVLVAAPMRADERRG